MKVLYKWPKVRNESTAIYRTPPIWKENTVSDYGQPNQDLLVSEASAYFEASKVGALLGT